MTEVAIGIAVMWVVVALRGKSFSVKGLPSILFTVFIAYGVGALIMLAFRGNP